MPKIYSMDLRLKVVEALASGNTATSVSKTFNIAHKTIYNWQKQLEKKGHLSPKPVGSKVLSEIIQDLEKFQQFVEQKPDRTSQEIAADWGNISSSTIRRYLRLIGFTNKKNFWVQKPLRPKTKSLPK